MIVALLGKSNESEQQLLASILGGYSQSDGDHANIVRRLAEHGGLLHLQDAGQSPPTTFDYAAHLPRFLEAMRTLSEARRSKVPAGSQQKTVMTATQDAADALEEETLADGVGPQSVLDAMLSSRTALPASHFTKADDGSSAWRDAARGVVFDNFFSEELSDEQPLTTSSGPRNQQTSIRVAQSETQQAVGRENVDDQDDDDDDEDLVLPGADNNDTATDIVGSVEEKLRASPHIVEALRDIANGEDGVEAFALDATHDYDANVAGVSRRI